MYACVILASIYSKLASPKNLAGPAVEYSISSLDCVPEVFIGSESGAEWYSSVFYCIRGN